MGLEKLWRGMVGMEYDDGGLLVNSKYSQSILGLIIVFVSKLCMKFVFRPWILKKIVFTHKFYYLKKKKFKDEIYM